MLLKGKCLKPGSTLGIIAPASPETKDFINQKLSQFQSSGYKVKLGAHIYDNHGYLAGSDINRANDIMDMFLDKSVDGIVCFRGGYGSIRTLPFIDINIIKSNPKFFCGYSDITILLNYFSKHGLITFHGPMINSNFTDTTTSNSFSQISTCNYDNFSYNFSDINNLNIYNGKSFSGKLVGGNLAMICSSIGTPYEVETNNSILLLEEVNESPYSVDRMLTHLILSKKLKSCKGILIGHMKGCTISNSNTSLTLKEIIEDRLVPLGIPIISGIPFGHDYPNITFPIGCKSTFDIDRKSLTIIKNFLT